MVTLEEMVREMRSEWFPERGRLACVPTATGVEQYMRLAYEAGQRDAPLQCGEVGCDRHNGHTGNCP